MSFKCNISGTDFSSKQLFLRGTKAVHENSRFECDLCSADYSSKQFLSRHKRAVHGDLSFQCNDCKRVFNRRHNLIRHIQTCHLKKKSVNSSTDIFICNVCGKNYSSEQVLRRHRLAVHENSQFQCNNCKRVFNRRHNLIRHLQGHELKKTFSQNSVGPYECDRCSANYSSKQFLLTHMRAVHENSVFQCNDCKRVFNRRHNLIRHLKSYHLKKKTTNFCLRRFKCDVCGSDYSSRQFLLRHIKALHENSNFQCNDCKYTFNSKRDLIRHVQTYHMGKKPIYSAIHLYECDVCESKFTCKTSVKRHKLSVHEKAGLNCGESSAINVQLQCDTCKLIFKRKDNLKRHLQKCFFMKNSISQYQCDICKRGFARKDNFRRHSEKCLSMKNSVCQSGAELKCEKCFDFFKNAHSVFKYMRRVPGTEIDHEHLEFATMDEFYSWKENLEKSTFAFYRKGTVSKGEQYTVYKFICHRSGTYVLKCHNRKRSEKLYGSKKVGTYCPAEISARLNNKTGSCKILYTKTHLGHNISDKNKELRHIYVSKTDRDFLASKVALGIPHDRILDENIETTNNYDVKKLSLLSGKDLQNITQSSCEPKCSDQVCVEAFISLHSRSIIYYKKQNELDDKFPLLSTEDIVIIIMTDSQKHFLQKYGENIVIVDGTYGFHKYNFLVHTLLVVDDDHEGIEVAFAVTNRSDEMVISIFFECIKNTVGCVKTSTLMTDMQENNYTSWIKVMGEPQFRLFTSWYVREAWRQNLMKITNKEKRNSVRNRLYMISSKLDENIFWTELNEFLDDKDPDLNTFIQYFKKNFVKNVSAWAYCYRKGALINTNMKADAFHSNLKKFIRKQNIRGKIPLYICLEVLSKFLQRKNTALFQKEVKGKIPYKLRMLRTNHNLLEKNAYILKVDGNSSLGWNISLSSDEIKEADVHFIYLTGENCQACRLYCTKCDACIHQFCCSCSDYANRFNMCIHIHALCIYLQSNNSNTDQLNSVKIEETPTECLIELLEEISMDSDETELVEEIIIKEEIEEPRVQEMKGNILKKVNDICESLETASDAEWLLKTLAAWEFKHQG